MLYPDFTGLLIVDGGVVNKDIDDYKELSVDIVVQGGAIFAEHP
jgi:pentose-5-phosphate-3-epimerase